MTVMFTHRETDMWNALGLALLDTGWEIGSSWPVHTESEHSLHIAQKNSARSTVFLYCRPRPVAETQSYWDQDLRNEVTRTAGERAREFQEAGIDGVDLYLSTFGPVLGVLSRHWPIISEDVDRETGESLPLEPEAALTIARREVFRLQREGLLDGRAANWDAATDWYLLAWKSFGAREFSYDEARKMAMAQGAEGDELRTRHRLLSQKSGRPHCSSRGSGRAGTTSTQRLPPSPGRLTPCTPRCGSTIRKGSAGAASSWRAPG